MNKQEVIDFLSNCVLMLLVIAYSFLILFSMLIRFHELIGAICGIVSVVMLGITLLLIIVIFVLEIFKKEK